jgi:hypothetical protein
MEKMIHPFTLAKRSLIGGFRQWVSIFHETNGKSVGVSSIAAFIRAPANDLLRGVAFQFDTLSV